MDVFRTALVPPRRAPLFRGLARACLAVAVAALVFAGAPAHAQSMQFLGNNPAAVPQVGPFAPPPSGPQQPIIRGQTGPGGAREPHAVLPIPPAGKAALGVFARFSPEGAVVPRGVTWRVFADQPESSGAFPLVAESTDSAPVFFLNPGGYIVHASYGLANTAERVQMGLVSKRQGFIMPAGGLRLEADVENKTISGQKVSFDIFEGSFLQGRTSTQPYYSNAHAGEIVLLPEGTYHVVSSYGDANAVVRADVNVAPGKLTDAVMHHRAAQVTLKLVKSAGGEAQADTQWTVITPGGDTIKESIGAFPAFVLTEGDYVAIARNDGKSFSREFKVEAGKDQEVEVLVGSKASVNSQSSSAVGD